MPLDADGEACRGELDTLDDAVGSERCRDEAVAEGGGCLVVEAVDLDLVRPEERVEPRARGDPDAVRETRPGTRTVVVAHGGPDERRKVLGERPAEGDVQDLQPAADREEWQVRGERLADELQLELVSLGARPRHRRMRLGSVERGADVDPPRQDEAVEPREERRVEGRAGRREDHRDASVQLDASHVVPAEDVVLGVQRVVPGGDPDEGRDAHRRAV